MLFHNRLGNVGPSNRQLLEARKCRVYFQRYKFVRGKPQMKRMEELPTPIGQVVIYYEGTRAPAHIRIPQPDGSTALIPTLKITESAKGLGVYFNVVGGGTDHLSHIQEKGMMRIDKLDPKLLPTRYAWMSFFLQLFLGMFFLY